MTGKNWTILGVLATAVFGTTGLILTIVTLQTENPDTQVNNHSNDNIQIQGDGNAVKTTVSGEQRVLE